MEIRAVFWVDGVKTADLTVDVTNWAAPYVIEQASTALRSPDMDRARLMASVDELPASDVTRAYETAPLEKADAEAERVVQSIDSARRRARVAR
jgi:hypothetical protein